MIVALQYGSERAARYALRSSGESGVVSVIVRILRVYDEKVRN